MNIETLKKIAIELGYEYDLTGSVKQLPVLFMIPPNESRSKPYEPQYNANQLLEIMDLILDKVGDGIFYIEKKEMSYEVEAEMLATPEPVYLTCEGKTIPEAIMNLMDEVMK